MADITRTLADTAGFVPQYWANRALDVLRSQIVLAQIVAKSVDFGEVGWKGKSITVPYPGEFTPVDKAADTPVTPQTPANGSSVTLTLSKHKVVPFLVEDFGAAQVDMTLMDRYIQPATIAIAEIFEKDLWMTAMQAGTLAPIGTPTTDLTAAIVRTAMSDLNTAKAPIGDRHLVMSPKDQAALLGDSSLATYFAFSQSDAIRNGYFGKLYGMDCYWSQLAPSSYKVTFGGGNSTFTYGGQTTGSQTATTITAAGLQTALAALTSVTAGKVSVSGPTTGPFVVTFDSSLSSTLTASTATIAAATSNIALHRNAVMYASRPFAPIPANAGVYTATASDPESGLSIRISGQYDVNNIGVRVNLDILYGMTVLRPTQEVQIVT